MKNFPQNFISEDNLLKHKEYLRHLKCVYSVLEKSYPAAQEKSIKDIAKMKMSGQVKEEFFDRKCDILLHELYFSSFSDFRTRCPALVEQYGSEANFLYEIEKSLFDTIDVGFFVIYINRKNKIDFIYGRDMKNIFIYETPILSIDLWEHSYFMDYGFDRKKYIRAAISNLNLNKINEFYKN